VLLANIEPEAVGVTVGGLIPARSYQFRLCAVNDFISPTCRSLALCCSQIAVSLSNYKDAAWSSAGQKEAV
jgi:hypothetical protein